MVRSSGEGLRRGAEALSWARENLRSRTALTLGSPSSSVGRAGAAKPARRGAVSTNDDAIRELIDALREVPAQAAEPNHVLSVILRAGRDSDRGVARDLRRGLASGAVSTIACSIITARTSSSMPGISAAPCSPPSSPAEAICWWPTRPTIPASPAAARSDRLRLVSLLCMPIRVHGRIAALVHLENSQIDYFQPKHAKLLRPLLTMAAPADGDARRRPVHPSTKARSAARRSPRESRPARPGVVLRTLLSDAPPRSGSWKIASPARLAPISPSC